MFNNSQIKTSIKKYILIVEDDEINQSILVEFLQYDYEITTANNGEECISSVNEHLPDLILLDIMMPVMDGYEVIKSCRNDPKYKDIPIIVVSAMATKEEKQVVYDLGVMDYITKPFEEEQLFSTIKKYL